MSELRIGDPCPCCGKPLVAGCVVDGCKAHVSAYSRIVGYLTPLARWNDGKAQEFRDRTEFDPTFAERKTDAHQRTA